MTRRRTFSTRLSAYVTGLMIVFLLVGNVIVLRCCSVLGKCRPVEARFDESECFGQQADSILAVGNGNYAYVNTDILGIVMAVYLLVAVIALFFLVRHLVSRLVGPLEQISETSRQMTDGGPDALVPDTAGHDEIQTLTDSFQVMQHSLMDRMKELKETTAAKLNMESELSIARNIQLGMVPQDFGDRDNYRNIDLYAILHPAKDVSGDLYDYFVFQNKLYLTVGDVSGKGIPASLFMVETRSMLRSLIPTVHDPARMMNFVNDTICENNASNMFVTIFLAVIDIPTGRMTFCNAGHNHPLLVSDTGETRALDVDTNMPVGLMKGQTFSEQHVILEPGMCLFLYTDGITEAENKAHELYGEKRLADLLSKHSTSSAQEIIEKVNADVQRHVDGYLQSDDIAILAMKYMNTEEGYDCHTESLTLNSLVNELTRLYAFIADLAAQHDFTETFRLDIQLALEEAIVNVVQYAHPNDRNGHNIEVLFHKRGDVAEFEVVDDGVPFNPTDKEEVDIDAPIEQRVVGGLGIHLIRKLTDEVAYRRDNGKNVLTMKKKICK